MIFSLDTSTQRLSLALMEEGKILEKKEFISQRRHNETLIPLLEELLKENKKTTVDMTGIVVGLGPGSFTGVRVGIAAALGLAQSLNLPVAGIPSYLAMAAAGSQSLVVVIGDARQDMIYAAGYVRKDSGWERFIPEKLTTIAELVSQLPGDQIGVAGPEAQRFFPFFIEQGRQCVLEPEKARQPDAGILAQLADGTIPNFMQGKIKNNGMCFQEIAPIYLRRTQAEEVLARRQNTPEA